VTRNPWLDTEDAAPEPVVADAGVPGGVVREWVPGVDGLQPSRRFPMAPAGESGLWVVGAHGGAGASTWAQILGAWDARGVWPVARDGASIDVVVAARTTIAGMRYAQLLGIEWAAGALPGRLVGLIAGVDAPGRLPKELRAALEVTRGAFPNSVVVPFQAQWRCAGMEGVGVKTPASVLKIRDAVASWTKGRFTK